MIVREASQQDIPTLAILAQETYKATFGHTLTNEELTEAFKSRSEDYFYHILNTDTILVVEDKNKLLGYIQFGAVTYESVESTDNDIELNKIYIDKNYQGKGIGKVLMKSMFEHPRLDRIENIYLDVFDENKKAIGLYEKYGFKRIGKTPFKLDGKIVGYDLLMKRSKKSSKMDV
ncbi:MAG: GNAT family N-acetyltransferase [Candidatus Levybacteria bacterium]|nr:GNAT family N-acetyltransferase [Candidatus Levybacteria bacterium]